MQILTKHDEHANQSMYKLLDQLFRGTKTLRDLEPLDVVRRDGDLFALRNRRQTILSMLQGAFRTELIKVPLRIYDLGSGIV